MASNVQAEYKVDDRERQGIDVELNELKAKLAESVEKARVLETERKELEGARDKTTTALLQLESERERLTSQASVLRRTNTTNSTNFSSLKSVTIASLRALGLVSESTTFPDYVSDVDVFGVVAEFNNKPLLAKIETASQNLNKIKNLVVNAINSVNTQIKESLPELTSIEASVSEVDYRESDYDDQKVEIDNNASEWIAQLETEVKKMTKRWKAAEKRVIDWQGNIGRLLVRPARSAAKKIQNTTTSVRTGRCQTSQCYRKSYFFEVCIRSKTVRSNKSNYTG